MDTEELQELEDYENPSKTSTPLKDDHPLSWWLKWASSFILILAMIACVSLSMLHGFASVTHKGDHVVS